MAKSQEPLTKLIFGSKTTYKFGEQKHAKKARKISWISLIIGILGFIAGSIIDPDLGAITIIAIITCALLIASALTSLLFVFNKKFYNAFIYLLIFVFIGFFFKHNHWPGAQAIMTIGFTMSSIGFFFIAFMLLKSVDNNRFLKLFGFFINIILSISFMGGLFKVQHWPGAGIMVYTGTLLFLIAVLALVFTLPNSNYLEWTDFHKKVFYRAIIIPMIYIFISSVLVFVFPDTWNFLFYGLDTGIPWDMKAIVLFPKEGL